jgi:UDP-N-acetylglucosamine--N-acetylmuramyl-(pentapeptide) pyrophosphoryl-undecaprenol N-acetylglucosamine transferase
VERWGDAGPALLHLCGERDYPALRDRVSRPDYRSSPSSTRSARRTARPISCSPAPGAPVWELAAAGLPAVLVPYPHATADHQAKNARFFEEAGGAVAVDESELDRAPSLVEELLADSERRERMREGMQKVARPGAADEVAEELIALVRA